MGETSTSTIYVVPTGRWGDEDIAGLAVTDEGEVLWQHVSSSMPWLRVDLTENFGRLATLEQRYPDGYSVVVVGEDGDLPDDVAEKAGLVRPEPATTEEASPHGHSA